MKLRLLIALLFLVASAPLASTAHPLPTVEQWNLVFQTTGNGPKQTDSFEIKGTKWRIVWRASPKKDGHVYILITVFDKAGKVVGTAGGESSADETYIHQSGSFYLMIDSDQPYAIKVEEWR